MSLVKWLVVEWAIGWHHGNRLRHQTEADRHAAREQVWRSRWRHGW